jgi:hypothetical protein
METSEDFDGADLTEGAPDDFEFREEVGAQGLTPAEFAQSVGAVVREQLAAHQAPPQESDAETYARGLVERHPDLVKREGAQAAVRLAGHVAQQMGNPDLVNDLAFVEAVHAAAKGARAGVDAPPLSAELIVSPGGGRGAGCLPFGQ